MSTPVSEMVDPEEPSQALQQVVEDSRHRVEYVIKMTTESVNRVLIAVEKSQPLQEKLKSTAQNLMKEWEAFLGSTPPLNEEQKLLHDTYHFLIHVLEQQNLTKVLLHEIVVAQEFQDLTGQVLKKILGVLENIEHRLPDLLNKDFTEAKMLLEISRNLPPTSIRNTKIRFTQNQIDELLTSVGI